MRFVQRARRTHLRARICLKNSNESSHDRTVLPSLVSAAKSYLGRDREKVNNRDTRREEVNKSARRCDRMQPRASRLKAYERNPSEQTQCSPVGGHNVVNHVGSVQHPHPGQ